jgi:hypothetical protein
MRVASIAEALDSIVIGHANAFQQSKTGLDLRGLEWIDVTNTDRKSVSLEMSSAKLVGVTIRPQKIDPLYIEIE